MADQKPLFKAPYDIKDVSALFAIVAFVLIIAAIVGNNLFGLFQENVNFYGMFAPFLVGLQQMSTTNFRNIVTIFFFQPCVQSTRELTSKQPH